jgi:peptidoglycan/LPS O-acetylase OafA/YrhL
MSASNSENQRAFGPDLIRAAAIVLVIMSHTIPGGTMFPALGIARDYWGVWGVEIFFVLSGYLIGGILINDFYAGQLNGLGGLFAFWKRRWFRTLPNYYLFLVLFLGIHLTEQRELPSEFWKYLWFGQALYSTHPVFYLMVWSLAIEEWFYLLFPIFLLVLSRLVARRERTVLATIALFLIAPMILRYFMHTTGWMGVRGATLPRLDAIAYGTCLAFIQKNHAPLWNFMVKNWLVGAGAVVAVYGHAYWHTLVSGWFSVDSIFFRVFYFCLISASIALLFPSVARFNPPASWWTSIVRKLSLWSYSMYLSHLFCFWLIAQGFKLFGLKIQGGNWTQVVGDMMDWVVTLAFSAMLYKYYEKPLMDLRERRRNAGPVA